MSHDKIYISLINSARWRRLRARVLADEPLCRRCHASGLLRLATEVHHIKPVESVAGLEQRRELAYSPANLMPLCHACHQEVHRTLGKGGREETRRRAREEADAFMRDFFGTVPDRENS